MSPIVRGVLVAVVAVAAATLVGVMLGQHASLADEAMLYALAILIAAYAGRGPGLVAAILSILAFDFFFVEPRYTLDVADPRFLITFAVMFAAGVAIGGLGARSRERERRTAALLSFTRDAAAASDRDGVLRAVRSHLRELDVQIVDDPLQVDAGEPDRPGSFFPRARFARLGGALDRESQQFVESVTRQATIAIDKLRLAEAAREAQIRAQSEELRSALLSAVSHDLRTPLAAIVGMATALRERAPAGDHEELDTIVGEADRLGRILENLLAVTKVEGGAKPRREWVPVEELVGSALARLDESLADRIAVTIDGDVIAHVDPVLGELMLVNLLDNAVKHTPARTPIELAARRDGGDVTLEIADRGPGLPPGTERRVFERFYRVPSDVQGVGLGLAVCRGIAVAHAGSIEAHGRSGGGAVFRVRIPDAAPMPALVPA